jgi:hypothetical protein
MQVNFGVGFMTFVPPSTATDPTPVPISTLQEVSLDIAIETKELIGNKSFPVDIAKGAGKITGKAKNAQIRASQFATVLGGSTIATGKTYGVFEQSTGVIAGASYDTLAAANFVQNLGVLDENGKVMKLVTGAPAAGEYQVSGVGVYTFNAAANGKTYKVSYTIKNAAVGKTVKLTNQLMGAGTTFEMHLQNSYNGGTFGIRLYAVNVPKIALAFKNTDHTMQDVEFDVFANAAGDILEIYSDEQ